jgi:hypothetical protein
MQAFLLSLLLLTAGAQAPTSSGSPFLLVSDFNGVTAKVSCSDEYCTVQLTFPGRGLVTITDHSEPLRQKLTRIVSTGMRGKPIQRKDISFRPRSNVLGCIVAVVRPTDGGYSLWQVSSPAAVKKVIHRLNSMLDRWAGQLSLNYLEHPPLLWPTPATGRDSSQ